MIEFEVGAVIVALIVTVLELTEVVALVFALSADQPGIRHGALGATAGVAVVAVAALAVGAAFLAVPHELLLWASAVVLAAFGVFLFRSTLKTYRRDRARPAAPARAGPPRVVTQFAGGFAVGAVEATEVVVVLLALAAAGQGASAILGAVVGGVALVAAAAVVHERIRRVKTRWLKLGATGVVFSFAVFWAGEAAGVRWPGADLVLLPIFAVAVVLVRGGLELVLRAGSTPAAPA
ncbi:MAG TPA: hypothetical protein VEH10_06420 [Thermoplasmata archaeon]|nr:hypothetical protein [Thermoplasmata archaeon]